VGFATRLHWTRVWCLQVGPSWPDGPVTAFVCYDTHCVCNESPVGVEGARSAGDEEMVWEGVILVLPDCWNLGGRSCLVAQVPKRTYISSVHAVVGGMACTSVLSLW